MRTNKIKLWDERLLFSKLNSSSFYFSFDFIYKKEFLKQESARLIIVYSKNDENDDDDRNKN